MKQELTEKQRQLGFSRRQIEQDLNYAEKYLDQILSKGGNERVLDALQRYFIAKSNPIPIKNADLNKQISEINEKLIRLEGYTTVLFDTAVAALSQLSGKQAPLIRAELQEAITMVLKHSLDQLRQK